VVVVVGLSASIFDMAINYLGADTTKKVLT
jgi:hypothetical protein